MEDCLVGLRANYEGEFFIFCEVGVGEVSELFRGDGINQGVEVVPFVDIFVVDAIESGFH